MNNFLTLLKHRKLIFTYRYMRCTKSCDICGLADRITEESNRNAGFKITLFNFRFNCRIALHTCYSNQIHIIKSQLCQLRNHGLNKNIGFFRVKSTCQIIQCNLQNILANFLRMFCIICKCLCICDHNINLVI